MVNFIENSISYFFLYVNLMEQPHYIFPMVSGQ